MRYSLVIAAGIALTTAATATPVMTPPSILKALGGDVKAVYVFADANDASILGLSTPTPAVPQIFCNHNTGSCTASTAGAMMDLGKRSGPLVFTLNDTTTHRMYDSMNPDSFGDYHVDIRSSYTYSGVPALSSTLMAELAALPNVTYVAWEDHSMADKSHDFDYNDLIFAFSNTAPVHNPGIPEPLTLSLMGMGLLGAFGFRRSKKS